MGENPTVKRPERGAFLLSGKERRNMAAETSFDYYYGDESNQFSFYRIPRQLVTGDRFKRLSTDAKLLYGLLLDTKPVLGNLLALLPDMNPLDGREALGVQASNLYHMACHSYLYSPDPNAALRKLGKPIFFCLRFFFFFSAFIKFPTRDFFSFNGMHRP